MNENPAETLSQLRQAKEDVVTAYMQNFEVLTLTGAPQEVFDALETEAAMVLQKLDTLVEQFEWIIRMN